jgi:hypothetical protein
LLRDSSSVAADHHVSRVRDAGGLFAVSIGRAVLARDVRVAGVGERNESVPVSVATAVKVCDYAGGADLGRATTVGIQAVVVEAEELAALESTLRSQGGGPGRDGRVYEILAVLVGSVAERRALTRSAGW